MPPATGRRSGPTLNVLQVVSDTDRRGSQTFAVELADWLGAHGLHVRTVALAPGAAGGHDLPTLGVRAKSPATVAALRRLMARADVVAAHGSTSLPACALAGVGLATPWVYRNIGDPLFWAPGGPRRLRVRLFLHRASAIAALYEGSRQALMEAFGVPARKLHLIPNGVDAARLLRADPADRHDSLRRCGLSPDRATIAYVGALAAEKDVPTLIRAVAGDEHMQLVLAGDGPERAPLTQLARRLLPGRVAFLGVVPAPRTVFDMADVVALTSRSEGLPGVLIEAGLCSLPVVATDVGGVSAVVLDGRSGRLTAVGDVAGTLRALRDALAHGREWGRAAHRHCLQHFDMPAVAQRWAELLRAVGEAPVPGGDGARGRAR